MQVRHNIPLHADAFESLCRDIMTKRFNRNFTKYGTTGNSQGGVDLLCLAQNENPIFVQCKLYYKKKLTKEIVEAELGKFKQTFCQDAKNPATQYWILTTYEDDNKNIQAFIHDLNKQLHEENGFQIVYEDWRWINEHINKYPNDVEKPYYNNWEERIKSDEYRINLPYKPDRFFTGRDDLLYALKQKKDHQNNPISGLVQVVSGLGGRGKTRLAVEYAWRYASEYKTLLFLNVDQPGSLDSGLARLAEIIDPEIPPGTLENQRIDKVKSHLRSQVNWLLVIDNVDNESVIQEVKDFVTKTFNGHILITSRWNGWPRETFHVHRLKDLSLNDAKCFLLNKTEQQRKKADNDETHAEQLATDLGCLCLALNQAAAYINECPSGTITVEEYRELWKKNEGSARKYAQDINYKLDAYGNVHGFLTTWLTTIRNLKRSEVELLNVIGLLANDSIPSSFMDALDKQKKHSYCSKWNSPESPLKVLQNYSLLEPGDSLTSIGKMHSLVHLVVRDLMTSIQYSQSLIVVVAALVDAFGYEFNDVKKDPLNCESWQYLNPLEIHIKHLLENVNEQKNRGILSQNSNQGFEHMISLASQAAALAQSKSNYQEAGRYYSQANELIDRVVINNQRLLATSKNNYAWWLDETASTDYQKAMKLFADAIELRKNQLNNNDEIENKLSLAESYNDFANFLKNSENYSDAKLNYDVALRLRKELNESYPEKVIVKRDLAITLLCKLDFEFKKYIPGTKMDLLCDLLKECMTIMRSIYLQKAGHDSVNSSQLPQYKHEGKMYCVKESLFAILLSYYGIYYAFKVDHENATTCFEDAIKICLKLVGESHVHTAKTMLRYSLYLSINQKEKPLMTEYFHKSIAILTDIHGCNSPKVNRIKRQYLNLKYWL